MSLAAIVAKWNERSSIATGDYEAGVRNPRTSWQAATLAAVDNWATAIREAITRGAFRAGVNDTTDQEWLDAVLTKGLTRWPEGIAASLDKYRAGFEPYWNALQAQTLPPRMPRGHSENYNRSRLVGVMLNKLRLSRRST